MTASAANQGPRGVSWPRSRMVSSLSAWGQSTRPAVYGAARQTANLCPAPAQFGRVAACSGAAPAALGQSGRWPGENYPALGTLRAPRGSLPRAGLWHFGRPDPTRAESNAATSYSLGDTEEEAQRLLCPGQRQNSWDFFVKCRGRAP